MSGLSNEPLALNHLTFSVADLDRAIAFYETVFGARLLLRAERFAYFDLGGLWLALNVETAVPRATIPQTYTHVAFTTTSGRITRTEAWLRASGATILPGRQRDEAEGESLYFADWDGYLFELHTGSRDARMQHYEHPDSL